MGGIADEECPSQGEALCDACAEAVDSYPLDLDKVALARKLAVILHRIWVNGTTFRWSRGRGLIRRAR
jgi:hypothetical protein